MFWCMSCSCCCLCCLLINTVAHWTAQALQAYHQRSYVVGFDWNEFDMKHQLRTGLLKFSPLLGKMLTSLFCKQQVCYLCCFSVLHVNFIPLYTFLTLFTCTLIQNEWILSICHFACNPTRPCMTSYRELLSFDM